MNEQSPPAALSDADHAPRVSDGRKRRAGVLLVVVAVVLAITLWQTWDYWHPADDEVADAGQRSGDASPQAGRGMPAGPPQGMFNPQEMRRRFHEQLKADMGAGDDEWATLRPKVEAVTRLQDELREGRGIFPPRPAPGPRGGSDREGAGSSASQPAGPGAPGPAAAELAETDAMLRAAVEDPQTPEQAVTANLRASRAARAKVEKELTAARDALRQGLTLRQEAALVAAGVLE